MFENRHQSSYAAARTIMNIMTSYIPNATRIIDVGCGVGTFLRASQELGFELIQGLDGDWVGEDLLEIPLSNFLKVDLNNLPEMNGKFDIALCLEVAEHLEESSATSLVHFLTKKADVVVFSAAIPGQGGNNHFNEQWQSYWEGIFKEFGFTAHDWIRPRIWENTDIPFWYKQNIVVYLKDIENTKTISRNWVLDVVHPEMFTTVWENQLTLKKAIRILPSAMIKSLLRRTVSKGN